MQINNTYYNLGSYFPDYGIIILTIELKFKIMAFVVQINNRAILFNIHPLKN